MASLEEWWPWGQRWTGGFCWGRRWGCGSGVGSWGSNWHYRDAQRLVVIDAEWEVSAEKRTALLVQSRLWSMSFGGKMGREQSGGARRGLQVTPAVGATGERDAGPWRERWCSEAEGHTRVKSFWVSHKCGQEKEVKLNSFITLNNCNGLVEGRWKLLITVFVFDYFWTCLFFCVFEM